MPGAWPGQRRRRGHIHVGLPAWGGALAAVPTLFDARQIALESYILPDAVFGFAILVAVALLLTKRTPTTWQCVASGLLLAWVSVLRGNGAPVMLWFRASPSSS